MTDPETSATTLLHRIRAGDTTASEELISKLYFELHLIAAQLMRGESR